MRDPKRIDFIVEQLRAVWKEHPDWRLTQLVCNASQVEHPHVGDPFYVEDDDIARALALLSRGDV